MDATRGQASDRLERLGVGAAVGLAAALWIAHATQLVDGLAPPQLPGLLLGLVLGALLADLVSGLVHWACDTWGDEQTPLFGPTLIYAFRDHHHRPCDMLGRHWTSVNRETGLAAAGALVGSSLPPVAGWLGDHVFVHALGLSLLAYGAAANQLHCWAHDPRPPRLVRRAQRLGLILSPERHRRHHRWPNTSSYCISAGWLNPALDRMDFWRRLERLVSRLTGATARRGQTSRRMRSS